MASTRAHRQATRPPALTPGTSPCSTSSSPIQEGPHEARRRHRHRDRHRLALPSPTSRGSARRSSCEELTIAISARVLPRPGVSPRRRWRVCSSYAWAPMWSCPRSWRGGRGMYAHECRPRRIELARPGAGPCLPRPRAARHSPAEIEGALTFLGVAQDFLASASSWPTTAAVRPSLPAGPLDGTACSISPLVRSTQRGMQTSHRALPSQGRIRHRRLTSPRLTRFAARLFSSVVSEGGHATVAARGLLPRSWSRAVRRRVSWPIRDELVPLRCKPCSYWPRSLRMTSSASRVVSGPSQEEVTSCASRSSGESERLRHPWWSIASVRAHDSRRLPEA